LDKTLPPHTGRNSTSYMNTRSINLLWDSLIEITIQQST
jgi:hypothetical protein